ncbi:mechanosensitive ion channel family protein [Arthrobacter halodurans]|uniref:Mechanosensitive ion channel family protein n=1 Tax=Arthrobacter halodurans TaxID=516699 RepID=A0ABV4UQ60_9MICC
MLPYPVPSTTLVGDSLEELASAATVESLPEGVQPWAAVAITLVAALVVTLVLGRIVKRVLRGHPLLRADVNRARIPFLLVLSFAGCLIVLQATAPDAPWHGAVDFLLLVGLIASVAWLLTILLHLVESALLAKYRTDLSGVRRMAKLRTQVTLLRRVATAVVLTLSVAAVLLLIPQVRALGAGILASAGLISVVAGLAVQGTLSNVFAGLQIAFTDAIRVDDTVFVEQQRGTVEEITLTYVVVATWDGRRLILPSTHFTTVPFENWSRGSDNLSGVVTLELNWTAPVEGIRRRVTQLLNSTELWDGREDSVSVSNVVGGLMSLSVVVSSRSAGDLVSLQNIVREGVIGWLREHQADALPEPIGHRPPA